MTTSTNRWSFAAQVEPSDKVRLRGFIRNEITYYNALLTAFAARMRTTPEVFTEVDEALFGEVAAQGYRVTSLTRENLPSALKRLSGILFDADGRSALSERAIMFLDSISVPTILHPETRRAMAIEMLRTHIRQADALKRTTNRADQVLAGPVELLHPIEARIKRHVQIPARSVLISDDGASFRTAYNGTPITLRPTVNPDIRWNIMVIRDEDAHGENGLWTVELRQESADYLTRLTDAPVKGKKRQKSFVR